MSNHALQAPADGLQIQLPNGLQVHCLSQPWLTRSAVCLRVQAGSHDEPQAYPGLAHFLEHLLFLGGAQFAGEQRLMPFVQACGGQLNASTQARHTDYFFEVPSQQLEAGLRRLLDMFAAPRLALDDQLREREVIHAEFMARSQDTQTLIDSAFGQALERGHPYQRFAAGQRSTLPVEAEAFQQALKDFFCRFYIAANCRLTLVGPQSISEFQHLISCTAALLAQAQPRARQADLVALKWRHQQLVMQLPNAAGELHVAFALHLASEADQAGLAFIEQLLLEPCSEGLSAYLKHQGWAQSIGARRLYQHAEQGLWLLSLHQVTEPERALACVLDALRAWQSQADALQRRALYVEQLRYQRQAMAPLALVRAGLNRCDMPSSAALHRLFSQLQEPERRCILSTVADELEPWPSQGFSLKMRVQTPWALSTAPRTWRFTVATGLSGAGTTVSKVPISAQLGWLVLDSNTALSAIACCQLQWRLALPLPVQQVLAIAQQRLQALLQEAANYGISLQWRSDGCALELTLKGARELLPELLSRLVSALLEPWAATPAAPPSQTGVPIRYLLEHCEWLTGVLTPAHGDLLLGPNLLPRLSLMGLGFTALQQAQIARMFSSVYGLQTPALSRQPQSGPQWRHLNCAGEAALLVFYPQPDLSPQCEAIWRLLGQRLQSRFYQRLRTELQLGYAVFCSYRQIQGRRGLLFGVQSGSTSAQGLLLHIRQFLVAQNHVLDEVAIEQEIAALLQQLQSLSPEQRLQQAWQNHQAGLSAEHNAQLLQAVNHLQSSSVRTAYAELSAPQAECYILSSQPCTAL